MFQNKQEQQGHCSNAASFNLSVLSDFVDMLLQHA